MNLLLKKEKEFLSFNKRKMAVWDAIDFLNTLVDDSDPDLDLDQTQHLLQTSEAIRNDGHEDWFILTGFLHDLGKFFVYLVNLSGLLLVTLFLLDVSFQIQLFILNFSMIILIFTMKNIILNLEYIKRIVVWKM